MSMIRLGVKKVPKDFEAPEQIKAQMLVDQKLNDASKPKQQDGKRGSDSKAGKTD